MRPSNSILIALLLATGLTAGTGLPAAGDAATLASAVVEPETAAARGDGPVRAPHSNLLLPAGATLVTDESRNMPPLPPSPGIISHEAREKVFTLNVIEGRLDTAVSLDAVVALYRREGVLTATQKPALEAASAPPMASPADPGTEPPAQVHAAVFNRQIPRAVLVMTTIQPAAGPEQVVVTEFLGTISAARALQVSGALTAARAPDPTPPPGAAVARRRPPLPPGAQPATALLHVSRAQIPALVRAINEQLPAGAAQPLGALVQQAQGVTLGYYMLPRHIADAEFFQFFQQVARQSGWQAVLEDQVRPGKPTVIYQLPDRRGVISITGTATFVSRRAGPGGGVIVNTPATRFTVIEMQGDVSVDRALPGR